MSILAAATMSDRCARRVRSLLAGAALALSVTGAAACSAAGTNSQAGEHSKTAAPASLRREQAPRPASGAPSTKDGDGDLDSLGGGRLDSDNDAVLTFGAPADVRDRRALSALVRRYYALAAAGAGAGACTLLYGPAAEAAVEEQGGGSPGSRRARTCARVASEVFARHRRELERQVASLEVGEARVKGNRGYVRLRFAGVSERLVSVHRVGQGWRVAVLLDQIGV